MTEAIDVDAIPAEGIALVSALAKELQALNATAELLEKQLKDCTDKAQAIETQRLPAAMDDIGMTEFRLSNGDKIAVKMEFHASIPKRNKESAFAWLREHELGDLIKNEVTVQFGKGEDDTAALEYRLLIDRWPDHPVSQDTTVHASTLKALVKEQFEAGAPLPEELFGIFIINRASITKG